MSVYIYLSLQFLEMCLIGHGLKRYDEQLVIYRDRSGASVARIECGHNIYRSIGVLLICRIKEVPSLYLLYFTKHQIRNL